MTRDKYLEELKQALRGMDKNEREDLLAEYAEHFAFALADGREEVEVAEALGNPKALAKEIMAEYRIDQARQTPTFRNIMRAVCTVGSLGFLNLVFVPGPLIAVTGGLLGIYAVLLVFAVSPLLVVIDSLMYSDFVLLRFLLSIVFSVLGIYLGRKLIRLTKWLYTMLIRYLNFNLNLVKKEG